MTSNSSGWDRLHRSIPNAPHVDVQEIRGNVSDADKQIVANVLTYICTGSGIARISSPFANAISRRLKIVGLNLCGDESEVILEIKVTESMCNVYGTMHGGCAAFLLYSPTLAVMVLLGRAKGFDGSGVSQSMNVYWHHPAPLGTTLTVIARSVFVDGRARLARCEIREKGTGKLVVSGTHAFFNAGRTKL
ncbi:HotDog domain-containing protein [Mycena leptocephala]|nr:HotDog domain-containing protein [Mycena leptocephala]